MSWTTPRTWVSSEIVTATIMNTHIRDNLETIWPLLWDSTEAGVVFPTASITTPALSQDYKSLRVVFTARCDVAVVDIALYVRMNGDAGANYDSFYLQSWEAGVSSGADTNAAQVSSIRGIPGTTSQYAQALGSGEINLPGYANGAFYKMGRLWVALARRASGVGVQTFVPFQWRNVAALSTLTFLPASGNFADGTRFTIYGEA